MKSGKTLEQLALELERQRAAKRDFIATTDSLSMSTCGGERFRLFHEGQSHMDGPQEFGMSNLFHRQLGASLGIPAVYYDKMREKYPELLAGNVNAWLGREPSRHMIRTLDGAARAYLSDRYRRIDHWEIAETVLPLIREMGGARVESCEITERRMYLKVVNPRLEAEVTKGDVVQAGNSNGSNVQCTIYNEGVRWRGRIEFQNIKSIGEADTFIVHRTSYIVHCKLISAPSPVPRRMLMIMIGQPSLRVSAGRSRRQEEKNGVIYWG